MYFVITTNKEVAEQIERQCAYDEKFGDRSYKLGGISHHEGHSTVRIDAKAELIEPSDIFWLGHFTGSRLK